MTLSIFSYVCMSSLEKCLFSSLAHFFIGSFIFLELSCRSSLHYLLTLKNEVTWKTLTKNGWKSGKRWRKRPEKSIPKNIDRDLKQKNVIFKIERSPIDKNKLMLTINQQPISEWFKEQWEKLQQHLRNSVQKKTKIQRIQDVI